MTRVVDYCCHPWGTLRQGQVEATCSGFHFHTVGRTSRRVCDSSMQATWMRLWSNEDQGHEWGSGKDRLKQLLSSIWDLELGMCVGWEWMEEAWKE